jgi:hypothetical protein
MHIKMLIDSIMQQTTVLIGQLSTAAGVRAPLARIADQVFVDLARELEQQGVGRRVAADMFGMALRSYQKKLRRLTASESAADRTLWSAVLEHIRAQQPVRKSELLRRFNRDGEREVGSILNDLVSSGLIYQTGRGLAALYRFTSEPDLRKLAGSDDPEALAPLVWSAVFDRPGTNEAQVSAQLGASPDAVQRAVQALIRDGRLRRDAPSAEAPLHAEDLVVPVGATHGWEVAVHDHFRAVANAIASKLQQGSVQSRGSDVVGGATLSFDVGSEHPYRAQVLGLLADVRERVNALWNEVEAFNARTPAPEAERERVFFYFGQYLQAAPGSESEREGELDDEAEEVG